MRCASCGYGPEWHDAASGHCPLCACGSAPAEHLPVTEPPSPQLAERHEHFLRCPSKPRTKSGALPRLRRGSYREPSPPPPYRLHASGFYVPVVDDPAPVVEVATVLAPRVPLRDTYALDEIAPRAMTLGKDAAALGWDVDPLYGVTGLGVAVSALRMCRGTLRALASWERPEGGKWRSAGAWGWLTGGQPIALGITELTKRIKGME